MNKKPQNLSNPNDDNPGGCYAPLENGTANYSQKKHYRDIKDHPNDWVPVSCDFTCPQS